MLDITHEFANDHNFAEQRFRLFLLNNNCEDYKNHLLREIQKSPPTSHLQKCDILNATSNEYPSTSAIAKYRIICELHSLIKDEVDTKIIDQKNIEARKKILTQYNTVLSQNEHLIRKCRDTVFMSLLKGIGAFLASACTGFLLAPLIVPYFFHSQGDTFFDKSHSNIKINYIDPAQVSYQI